MEENLYDYWGNPELKRDRAWLQSLNVAPIDYLVELYELLKKEEKGQFLLKIRGRHEYSSELLDEYLVEVS